MNFTKRSNNDGISVTFPGPTGHSRSRQIEILSIPAEDKGNRSSASSDETLFSPEKIKGNLADGPADNRPERPDDADDLENTGSSALKSSNSNALDGHADDADDLFPLSSAERPNSEEEVFEL